ncbi:MAG: ATP-binding protein [Helicobacteraceae bacterium]|nr:ATP-binding protein [Candidatus Sulfurimonas ponti]
MPLHDFFTSGHSFLESENERKNKFQMLNIAIVLSTIALLFGITSNIIRDVYAIVFIEIFLVCANILLFFILRKNDNAFRIVSTIITIQFSLLFLALMYMYEPGDLKHVWLFTYPIILLYFQNTKSGFYWLAVMLCFLFILPFQTLFEVHYSLFQITYLSVALVIVSVIMYFYQLKMNEVREIILKQQYDLQYFNTELELKVEEKTRELVELNESLEGKVKEKVQELIAKDQLLTAQSKQAVMGEMISMIAHQWRQPLSTITLQISNLHLKRLLNQEVSIEECDKVLREISDSIMYLSDTIDDFQTYFQPQKEKSFIDVTELIERAINFLRPRMKNLKMQIIYDDKHKVMIETYENEMVQIILNIINNTIDAFIENEIQNAKVYIDLEENEDSVVIVIKDNAGGIDEENISKIFEPYFSTKGKNGTGLGLYMCQMIVEKHFKGEIRVASSKDETTFEVEIAKKLS